jgi:hypothetical protein
MKVDHTFDYGTILAVDLLWEKLGLKKTFSDIVKANGFYGVYESDLFAMTAIRL